MIRTKAARTSTLTLALTLCALGATAATRPDGFSVDLSASGLVPVTWAADGAPLSHLGFDALAGFEYDSTIALQLRLETGYLNASASRISSSGELYRGWEGLRIALLLGYGFESFSLGQLGFVDPSLFVGGALTAADYLETALAYAYTSVVLEPRVVLRLRGRSVAMQGPWVAIPIELMFRGGAYTIAPGISLGWRYMLGVVK